MSWKHTEETELHPFLTLAIMEASGQQWAMAALSLGKHAGTNCIGRRVSPGAGLDDLREN